MEGRIAGLPAIPVLVPALPSPSSSTPASSTSPLRSRAHAPRRRIFIEQDLQPWFRSEALEHVQTTILRLTQAVQGRTNDEACFESEATKLFVGFLNEARGWIAAIPLQTSPQRFGNKAFRDWLAKVENAEPALQRSLLNTVSLAPKTSAALLPELAFHLLSSFGSPARLDYGTGHELSFLAYLTCLLRARVFTEADEPALVTRVFKEYIETVREVQRVFRLEPAGSKGVWGLDDHQHLVYLFGAAQLVGHLTLRPSSILSLPTISPRAPSYLFLSSIAHIHSLKRGPFNEHSPLLHQIATTVPTFAKVTKGLWEMYKVEVLGKVPVVQHCRFGELGLRWVDRETGEALPSSGDGRADDEDEEGGVDGADEVTSTVITPAPWATTGAPGVGGAAGSVRPLPPPSRLAASTSASTSFSHRQHPTTFPLPPPSVQGRTTVSTSAARASFQPPPLFPPRRSVASSEAQTLAQQGGAAASSSPFGVLPTVSVGGPETGGTARREVRGGEGE
ncbi:hypothetical protein Rhopal_003419-T1 [Rhodotorula paludigena]|uniref:Serine/threonine-protein phosphatase 2A activator n=1 Tax=Rhodotorula paludigena TaxID=86838 RepID=A0AAV5GJJ6_9BASI|nr:hypothetical protein Rhopal_003419-T1 [Rhodotorula paludigena]